MQRYTATGSLRGAGMGHYVTAANALQVLRDEVGPTFFSRASLPVLAFALCF